MMVQVETFAKSSDAPAQISPELVLVAPPEEARAAREALAEPQAPERAQPRKQAPAAVPAPRAEVLRRAVPTATSAVAVPRAEAPRVAPPPPPPPPVPVAPVRRRRPGVLMLGVALALAAGGFVAGRQLGERNDGSSAAVRPGTVQSVSQPGTTNAQPQSNGTTVARSTSTAAAATTAPPAPTAPSVSWKPHAGVRHYRLDLVRKGAVVLTILTDQPRADIPLKYPNAGRESRLAPGTYAWRVRAGTARPSRVLAHGTVRVH